MKEESSHEGRNPPMKETMKQHLHAAERKIIQNMIRREYDGLAAPKRYVFLPAPPPEEKARGSPTPDSQQVTPS